jgi:competence protein ComGC
MKNFVKTNKGITLIALVVTIIVLLILAGISIQMLTGQNGILKRAGEAEEKTGIGQEKEIIALAYNSAVAKKRSILNMDIKG